MKIYQGFLLTVFLWGVLITEGVAQDWDYEKYPRQDVEYLHLDAELRIDDDGVIEGDLLYNLRFRVSGLDSLILDATGMDISGVSVNERSRDFSLEKDRLIIYLSGENGKGTTGTLRVRYRAEPGFALHHSLDNTVWTSLLPRSVRHWLPVADHPRNKFSTEMIFTHPAGKSIIANGRRGESEEITGEEEITTFRSNRPLPASSLTWILGDLTQAGSTTNLILNLSSNENLNAFQSRSDSHIYLYSEVESIDGDYLLNLAAEAFQNVQNLLGVRYPFRDLHIVVLEDGMWETKSYGSGMLYIFNNRGNFEEQIQKGVLSQWVGAYLREEQWADAGAVNLLRALVAEELFNFDQDYEKEPEPYHVFSDHELWLWQHYLTDDSNQKFKEILKENLRAVVTETEIIGWMELARFIYDDTGQPYFDVPVLQEPEEEEEDTVEYLVEMDWDEEENTVRLDFEAVEEGMNELVSILAEEISSGDTNSSEITITGNSETVVLNVSRSIENLKLTVTEGDGVVLSERKPFLFWIHQLRNDANADRRKEAAAALSQFTDNPDLQLALTDLLRIETNPEVYAEILKALSAVTRGASGTEQIFIEHASGDQPSEVQKAAAEGLAYYAGNERVIPALRRVITETGDREIRRTAIRSLYVITDADAFRNISESVITTESVLQEVPMILELLNENEDTETAIRLSDVFLDEGFPPQIREEVLKLVLKYDNSEAGWEERLPGLVEDPDPRIRYLAVNGLENISPDRTNEIIMLRLVEEYDERVRRQIEDLPN